MRNSRRAKHFILSNYILMDFFRCLSRPSANAGLALPVLDGDLPEDARLVAMHTDWERNAIVLLIESAEFDEIEEGAAYPVVESTEVIFIRKVKPEDAGFEEELR